MARSLPEGEVVIEGGIPQQTAKVPADWWDRVERHENLGSVTETREGKALVTMLPFRLPRPPHPPGASREPGLQPQPGSTGSNPATGRRPGALIVELAIPLKAVSGAFDGLRRNLILGMIASIALLASMVVITLRTPQYLRGRYLESELRLAKRVQKNLQPRPHAIPPGIEFAASAVAADHVGGDFYDIFEAGSGKIAIVLGDVSGKGVSAALLVSVLQGAIRSSTASEHESACEKINRMLCEQTAHEHFATLFWGVFDPANGTLRYVNAGHAAPLLVRHRENRTERLGEGGPLLGVLPMARYSAGTVQINPSDALILYSDGVNEAVNEREEEFGEHRILETIHGAPDEPLTGQCDRIMRDVAAFSNAGPSPDDRTLMVVRFLECGRTPEQQGSELLGLEAVA